MLFSAWAQLTHYTALVEVKRTQKMIKIPWVGWRHCWYCTDKLCYEKIGYLLKSKLDNIHFPYITSDTTNSCFRRTDWTIYQKQLYCCQGCCQYLSYHTQIQIGWLELFETVQDKFCCSSKLKQQNAFRPRYMEIHGVNSVGNCFFASRMEKGEH